MKDYAGTFVLVALTTVIGIGCYSAAAHGASQRGAIDDMRRALVSETRNIRDLEVELRTRARLPQLERWNDQVLKMSAPAASQFMGSPVQLISLVAPPKPALPDEPQLRFALAPGETEDAGKAMGKVLQVRFALDEQPADAKPGVVRAAYPTAAPSDALKTTLGEP